MKRPKEEEPQRLAVAARLKPVENTAASRDLVERILRASRRARERKQRERESNEQERIDNQPAGATREPTDGSQE